MNRSSSEASDKFRRPRGLSRLMAHTGRRAFMRATVTHGVFKENIRSFARVIDFVSHTYHFVEPATYFEFLESECHDQRPVRGGILMTFDDGLLSSYEFIVNELTPRGIRVIMFAPTAVLAMTPDEQHAHALQTRFHGATHLREEQYLTIGVDEVGALAKAGHWVMPHSHTHACLATLETETQFLQEIVRPRTLIEELVRSPANVFAIPYGGRTAITTAGYSWIARTYAYCFTAIGGRTTTQSNRLLLRRDNMDQTFDKEHMQAVLDGRDDLYNHLKAQSQRLRLAGLLAQ